MISNNNSKDVFNALAKQDPVKLNENFRKSYDKLFPNGEVNSLFTASNKKYFDVVIDNLLKDFAINRPVATNDMFQSGFNQGKIEMLKYIRAYVYAVKGWE